MNYLFKQLKNYMTDEEGQTAVEYVLLLVVVVAIIMKFKTQLEEKMGALIKNVFDDIDKQVLH
jgi:Flp pilus assembly pilin Flp